MRPSLGDYALTLAEAASTRSEDPKRKVGAAVIGHHGEVLSLGYNGPPSGMDLTPTQWEDRDYVRRVTIHAEANALRYIRPGEASFVASTYLPCADCMRAITAQGVRDVWVREWSSTRWSEVSESIVSEFGLVINSGSRYPQDIKDADAWTMDAYQDETDRTGTSMARETAALGLIGEAGEVTEELRNIRLARVADMVKKDTAHGVALDTDALAKELGDELWYLAQTARKYGLTLNDVTQRNVDKLRARYPAGFTQGGGNR